MPTTTGGSQRGDATSSFERRLIRVEDGVRQLRERAARPQKIPDPIAPTGWVGQAEVVATSGTVSMPSGAGNLDYGSVTYDTPYDPNLGTDGESSPAVSSWLTVSGYQLTVSAGLYIPVLYIRVIWNAQANAPTGFGPYIQGGDDAVHNDYKIVQGGPYSGGRWGLVDIVNHGPTWMDEGASFHAELRPIGGNPTGDSNPSQSALLWDITKLS